MKPIKDFVEAELQASEDSILTEPEPFIQQFNQRPDPRPAINPDHVEVNPIGPLQIRRSKQMRHQLLNVHSVRLRYHDNSGRGLVIRFIPEIDHHWQLLCLHLGCNLL